MSKRQYETARDLAWRVLLECGIEELPVKPSIVCRKYGWVLSDYPSGAGCIAALGLAGLMAGGGVPEAPLASPKIPRPVPNRDKMPRTMC